MYIEELVLKITKDITEANQLNIENISGKFNILVIYHPILNLCMRIEDRYIIYIKQDSEFNMWQSFCHELGHCLLHDTNQLETSKEFNDKQEAEANKFALLFMMPEHLIKQLNLTSTHTVSEYFQVPYSLAYKRIEHLRNLYFSKHMLGYRMI